jgi:hypothetical protein
MRRLRNAITMPNTSDANALRLIAGAIVPGAQYRSSSTTIFR